MRNGVRALELATKANQTTGGKVPKILSTLAAAYAETGKFPEAIETANRALQLAEAQSNAGAAAEFRREIQLYEAGRKFEAAH